MRTTKLYSRFITLFLLLLFGFALGAKSAGIDSFRFSVLMAFIAAATFLHIMMMRKKFARYHNTKTA